MVLDCAVGLGFPERLSGFFRQMAFLFFVLFEGGLFACGALVFGCLPTALAFPCIVIGLLASSLCGAAPTFFAAA
jgi:hypothetical protein